MGSTDQKKAARLKRKQRIRKNMLGTAERPRLSVFRSARHIYAQVIDDTRGQTMASASSLDEEVKGHADFENKVAKAAFVGQLVGKRLADKGVRQVVFDRNGFRYHGRVKALSDGAREAGLEF